MGNQMIGKLCINDDAKLNHNDIHHSNTLKSMNDDDISNEGIIIHYHYNNHNYHYIIYYHYIIISFRLLERS